MELRLQIESIVKPAPRIYVASLADYNAGRIHGTWIDAEQSGHAIHEAITKMLAASPEAVAEDWAIHDYEGFAGLSLDEHEDLDHVAHFASLLREHGPVVGGLTRHLGGLSQLDEVERHLTEAYAGAFVSVADYAREFYEETSGTEIKQLPDILAHHIDYDSVAHDLEISGDIFTVEFCGAIHVFYGYA